MIINYYLGWGHLDDGSITRFDLLWEVFHLLTGSAINLFLELGELEINALLKQKQDVYKINFTRRTLQAM